MFCVFCRYVLLLLFEVELGVGDVVLGIVSLARTDGLEVLGRYASPDFACRDLCVLEHEGASGYDAAFAHLTAIEEGSAHADEGVIVDGTGMNGNVMTYRHVVADVSGTRVESDMNATAVLDIRAVADGDGSHIATNDSIEPYRTFVAHRDIAYNRGVLTKIAISPPFGSETSITFYQSHTSMD